MKKLIASWVLVVVVLCNASVAQAEWRYELSTDDFTDEKIHAAWNYGSRSSLGQRSFAAASCKGESLSAYFYFGEFITNKQGVMGAQFRIADEDPDSYDLPAFPIFGNFDTEGTTFIVADSIADTILKMMYFSGYDSNPSEKWKIKQLKLRISNYKGTQLTREFPLDSAKEAIGKVFEACNYKPE